LNDLAKLRVLLAHWAEHNREHLEEFRRWALVANRLGATEAASHLEDAVIRMEAANESLLAALEKLGSPARDRAGEDTT